MVKFIFSFSLLIVLVLWSGRQISFAQTPIWQWAKGYLPTSGAAGPFKGLGTDAAGNVYQAGGANAPITIGNTVIPANKTIIIKTNSAGNVVWAKALKNDLGVNDFRVDARGNIYLTGTFRGTVSIGSDTLTCQGAFDMFIAKLDSAGNGLWARRAGGIGRAPGYPPPITNEDGGKAIGTDSVGNVYVAGYFYARSAISVNFDSIVFNYPAGSPVDRPFGFLAKYNPNGKIQWVRPIDSQSHMTSASDLAVTSLGDCYLTGNFGGGGVVFGPGSPPLTSQGGIDIWVARYDTNGNLGWAKRLGGANNDVPNAIALTRNNGFFLTGYFYNSTSIGSFQLTNPSQKGTLFLARFDAGGNVMMANQTHGSGSIGDAVMVVDALDNAYVGASFSGTIIFGQQTLSGSALQSPVLLKWHSFVQPEKAAFGVGYYGSGYGVALDPTGTNCYFSGYFERNLSFDNYSLYGGNGGIFLAKLGGIVNSTKNDVENYLRLYPNPAQDQLYLDLPETSGTVTVKLTDMQGREVLSREVVAAAGTRLTLPSVAKGVYLVTVQTQKQILRQKLVIE